MADPSHRPQYNYYDHRINTTTLSTKSRVCATVAGAALGGPLLGLSGFSFVATLTLLLITSPLLLIFSPLLLGAGLFLICIMSAFGVATLMGVAGISSLSWVVRSLMIRLINRISGEADIIITDDVVSHVVDSVKESEEQVKEVLIGDEEDLGGDKIEKVKDNKESGEDSNINVNRVTEKGTDEEISEKEKNKEGTDDANVNVNVDVDERVTEKESDKSKEVGDDEGKYKGGGDVNVNVEGATEKKQEGDEHTKEVNEEVKDDKEGEKLEEEKESKEISSEKEMKKKKKKGSEKAEDLQQNVEEKKTSTK